MAEFNTDIAALQSDSTGSGARVKDGSKIAGEAKVAQAIYTIVGTEAVNDVINIVRLNPGVTVLQAQSSIQTNGVGTTLGVDLSDDDEGTTENPVSASDQYGATLVLGGAAKVLQLAGGGGAQDFIPRKLNKQAFLQATITGAAGLTAGKVLVFNITYV